ncbi:MAG: glycine zipper 2TM domain-containing protein [Proteobacteria bacterium]|nr:glycine zipper 2TM domain-containing protein [Pseudomonadota bacterium]
MPTPKILCLLILIHGLLACASNRDPVIDPKGVNMLAYQQDLLECRVLGENAQVVADTATSAVGGAAVGGIIGAAIGNSEAAKRGAGVGAVLGGVRGYRRGISEEDRIVRRCLMGRGYRVLN